jgi:hypothetical protein
MATLLPLGKDNSEAINLDAFRKSLLESELVQARIEAERKKGRELAKRADQNFSRGRVSALCDVAAYFIGKDRLDIARHVLDHFMVDREKAVTILEADKRVKNITLAYLDRAGAWCKPSVPEAI